MARGGITKSTLLILRGANRAENRVMKFSGTTAKAAAAESSEEEVPKISGKTEDSSAIWVPHPRTGIYYPKGHECVMEDVPEGAARFTHTYWFRNVDHGVGCTNTQP
ncbi:uncharacterized protein LOC130721585 [Lotus japonicus]|uniref:uncharacterized protein LOC130721585 n=1 Tax=Lotus japonicus TaxID=34305 RepID=UPI002584899A|nr:uncharacterized protein LOC130721585 [Lotus japonicus]